MTTPIPDVVGFTLPIARQLNSLALRAGGELAPARLGPIPNNVQLIQSPTTGIPGATGDKPGEASDCKLWAFDGTDVKYADFAAVTVKNRGGSIPPDMLIWCEEWSGFYYPLHAGTSRMQGTLQADLQTDDLTVIVDNLQILDGLGPAPISLTVHSPLRWNGDAGDACYLEWNGSLDRWQLYQLDCPVGGGVTNP